MRRTGLFAAFALTVAFALPASAQTAAPPSAGTAAAKPAATPATSAAANSGAAATPAARSATAPNIPAGITPPGDYVIGVDDQFDIVYWQDKEMSATVSVRPDGYISLPLLNDVKAAGLTPDQLRVAITDAATKFVEGPTVSVVTKAINSRKVFIQGQIGKPGPYPLMASDTTVLQMLATAGGPTEYAKTEKITIIRRENGKDTLFRFNYKNVTEGKGLKDNIVLKPGDTITVP